jgi:hypothetical protein
MPKTILAAVAASAIIGVAAGGMIEPAQAQTPPGQSISVPDTGGPGMLPGPQGPGPGMMHDGMMGHPGWWHWKWMHHMHWMMHHHGPFAPGTFALFDRHVDRHLSAGDVVKIAQGILLWFGNHTWQVGDVVENPDWVGFAFTAPDGTVIARFTMDRHNGHLARVG